MSIKDSLLTKFSEPAKIDSHKITVVGTGSVGMAALFSILAQGISDNICLIDVVEDKLMGEMMDLQYGGLFLGCPKLQGSTDYAISAGSKVCIIAAGESQEEGESRLMLVQKNTDILKEIIPKLVKYSPDTILLIVTTPCDVLTYVAWKLSGLPKHKVIGSGTNLDTSRFRLLISEKLGVPPNIVHGWIIGEHGDSSVAVWSGVNVAGVKFCDIFPDVGTEYDPECWYKVHQKGVAKAAHEIIKRKGYTSWAIGLSVAAITKSIVRNLNEIHAVSTYIKGEHGLDYEVFISLPAVINFNGVSHIVKQQLTENERCQLKFSAATVFGIQCGVKI